MKAIVRERYGKPDVLELREVGDPVVKDDRVLIRVRAASVNRSDWEGLTARPFYVRIAGDGFWKPKRPILGSDIAGTVEAVGSDVTLFRSGDEVFGDVMWHGFGAFAEYVSVPESAPIVLKPAGISFEEAAALPQGAVLALQGLRDKGQVQAGQRVLIVGAGGGGGTFAIQLAKALGAEVTGVDHTAKLEAMQELGADHVIDYTKGRFSRGGRRFDRIVDFVGSRSIFVNRRALAPEGVYRMVGGSMPRMLQAFFVGSLLSKLGSKQTGVLVAKTNKEDMAHVGGLVAAGDLVPVIDRRYDLADVPEALQYMGEGRAVGKLVITI